MKYAIVGGDARSAQLAAMLAQDGHRVCAFALEKADVGEAVKTGCLQGCVYGADCVVLPVPAESGGLLNTPLSDNVLRMSEVMGALWTGQILIAGRLSDASAAQGLRAGVHMEDVMLRPEFLMGNAALTAECAIARLIDESDRALMDSAVLVCGWGRIGRLLALRLAALGASVTVAGERVSEIQSGFLVLVGAEEGDTEADARYCADKIAGLRVFEDADDKMNLSLKDVGGSVLLVSQFTLLADARHGRRPNFVKAARPEQAEPLCERLREMLAEQGVPTLTGRFRTHMEVELLNDGPVTILLDSKKGF